MRDMGSMNSPTSVYIHIPFCAKKCHYCDFNTYVAEGQPIDHYLDALIKEMKMTAADLPNRKMETVFVGGGTPTILNVRQMQRLLEGIHTTFSLDSTAVEFTMEANPGTTEPEKLRVMKQGGVNRLSFGVQSFQDELLQAIGRVHDVKDVYTSINDASQVGFNNISIDLMFGLPRQTVSMVEQSLDKALALDLPHYSLYSLKLEENTLFHALYQKNQLPLPNEDEEYTMYKRIRERLLQAGYKQYEISNFAKPGRESKHNITYWKNQPYLGIGAGAHGYNDGVRHMNFKGVQAYIDRVNSGILPRKEVVKVSRAEAMEDFMMVGLRMLDGISGKDFLNQFGVKIERVFGTVIHRLLKKDLLIRTRDGYKLTEQGLLFGNEVFAAFIGEASGEWGKDDGDISESEKERC